MKKLLSILFLAVLSIYANGQVNLTQSLTACYALNGNALEPISSLNGTLSAVTPTVDRFNNPNSAMAFNGTTSSFIELPDSPLLKSTSAMSFGGWVRTTNLVGQYIFFSKSPGNNNFEAYDLVIVYSAGNYRFRAQKGNNSSTIFADATSIVNANTWYHVFVTVDNNNLILYVNGNQEASTPVPYGFDYEVGKNVVLGGSNEAWFNLPFYGSMDNIRFYNRVVNASEVSQIYIQDPACTAAPTPLATFSVSSSTICANQNVMLSDLSTNTPTAWAWQMSGATPSVSSLSNPVISYPAAGNYTISLTPSNSFGQGNTATQTITVLPLPTITTSASNTLICNGSSAALLANGATSYTWSNGQAFQAASVSPTITTTYTVTGTGSNGCKNVAFITITVDACTSIKQTTANTKVEVFPNPNSGKFMISTKQDVNDVRIYNLLGELILTTDLKADNDLQIDLSNNPNGIYFLKATIEGQLLTRKIVKD